MIVELSLLILSLFFGVCCVYYRYRYVRLQKNLNRFSQDNQILEVEVDRLTVFRKVVDTSPELFMLVDHGFQIIVANKTANHYGWQKNALFMESNISETSKFHFEVEIKRVLQTGVATDGEVRLIRKTDGKWSFFIYNIFPVLDEESKVVAAALTGLDITAQREAEEELHRERAFVEGILNAIPDPIYVKNDHHEWIYGNKAFSNVIGKKSVEYIGKKEDQVWSKLNADRFKKIDREVLRTEIPNESEEEFFNGEGQKLTVLSKRAAFTLYDGRKVLLSIMRDISERKRLEAELQNSKARQLEASRLATLGETAGGIAHEINNPLNVLVGVAELMQMLVAKNGQIEPEKLKEYCDRIIKFSMRIAKIVKGLRAISRDASQDPFSDVELGQLLEEALELCRQQYLNRGIQVEYTKPEGVFPIQGRFAQISQIVMNILNNARDAAEGTQNPTIHVELFKTSQGEAVIRVWDSGSGVPEEIEHQIMNPFFTTKPVGKGTGLGLSISRALADEHKGHLRLNRAIAPSCFEVTLPLDPRITNSSSKAS